MGKCQVGDTRPLVCDAVLHKEVFGRRWCLGFGYLRLCLVEIEPKRVKSWLGIKYAMGRPEFEK
jgi:hypothetical protein